MAIESEFQKLVPSAMLELFEIDLTALGDDVYYFHAGTNSLQSAVTWQGNVYTPWPAQASGFDYSGSGQLPRPKLALGNVTGLITALILSLNDCVGGKVTRRRTMVKYLDVINFSGGVNPDADPNAHLPDEIYFIDRKSREDRAVVEFELTAAFDVTGVKLPRRQVIQNLCPWRYRGGECGYVGVAYFKADDTSVASAALDVCGKRLSSCKARFGENNELPFGAMPGAGLVR